MEKRNILIGGAWPYANSSLHLGHIAGLISGDVLARYFRLKGDNVLYVSGTDSHGTPITERAKKEGRTPDEIVDHYHEEFTKMFNGYNFSYDLYSKTKDEYHKTKVQELFKKLYDNGFLYEKYEDQVYCEKCGKFLADREISITCPVCGDETKGDQCDKCLHVPTVEELFGGTCLECGSKTVVKQNKNLYFALSKFQDEIAAHLEKCNKEWRINAKNETDKYLKQGLKDRAVTRDLSWGVDIPVPGYEDKKMYVWIDAVLGYVTNTMRICEDRTDISWEDFWKNGHNNKIYMCHGKDNIVFHSIIFNALLLGQKEDYKLVDTIVSTEYLNYNDQKFSKSKGIGMQALEALDIYDSDSLRFYLIANGPEKKDTNFSPDVYEAVHNSELVNKFGNLVNRTLKFKGLENLPEGEVDGEIKALINETYEKVGKDIEALEFKAACDKILDLVEAANKYYDSREPWKQRKEDEKGFNDTIYTCSTIIANLSNLYEPIMPVVTSKIRNFLNLGNASWEYTEPAKGLDLSKVEPLFSRIVNK